MNTQEVIQATNEWKHIKDTPQGYNYLISGIKFEFSRENYLKWKELEKQKGRSIETISCHLGIWNEELIFCFTNSITGNLEHSTIGKDAFVTYFHNSVIYPDLNTLELPRTTITKESATNHLLNWMLYSKEWFNYSKGRIMSQVDINFSDFEDIFTYENIKSLIGFFSISPNEVYGNIVEIVLCSKPSLIMPTPKDTSHNLIFTDVTKPIPPFDPSI